MAGYPLLVWIVHLYSEFSPIDLTAEGVVKIAQYADRQTVFHLNSNRPIYFDRFLEVVHGLGISMRVVDGDSFTQALRSTIVSCFLLYTISPQNHRCRIIKKICKGTVQLNSSIT